MARGTARTVRKINRERFRKSDEYGNGACSTTNGSKRILNCSSSESMTEEVDMAPYEDVDSLVYGDELGSWLSCECFFSLLIVGMLAILPFNLHSKDLLHCHENYLMRADELYTAGDFLKARAFCEKALSIDETAYGYFYLAKILAKSGKPRESLQYYYDAVGIEKNLNLQANSFIAIGNMYQELGKPEIATENFEMALYIKVKGNSQDISEAYFNLANSLMDIEQYDKAIINYKAVIQLSSDSRTKAEVYKRLSEISSRKKDKSQSISYLEEAVRLDPQTMVYRNALIYTYMEVGQYAKASVCLHQSLDAVITPSTLFKDAALRGVELQDTDQAPAEYLRSVFDLFAERLPAEYNRPEPGLNISEIQHKMRHPCDMNGQSSLRTFCELNGMVHPQLGQVMSEAIIHTMGVLDGDRWLDLLDVGCGCGFQGFHFRELANYMVGVDISPVSLRYAEMIESYYDELKLGDITEEMSAMEESIFDVVLAVDSMPYFGSIGKVFNAAWRVLRPGGIFAASFDLLQQVGEGSSKTGGQHHGYSLKFTGRWSHTHDYIMTESKSMGYELVYEESVAGSQPFEVSPTAQIQRIVHNQTESISRVYLFRKP